MFMPERIDHHGWQLALLAWAMPRLPIPRGPRRAGARARDRFVAGDRARNADLPRARWGRGGAVVGHRRAESASGCALMRWRSAAGPRSPFCCSPPTTIATRCATPCRRCGCPTRCSAAHCCSRWPGSRPANGRGGLRWPRARAWSSPPSMPWLAALPAAGSKACRPKSSDCGSAMCARRGRSIATAGGPRSSIVALPVTGLIGWALLAWSKRRDRDCCAGPSAAAPGLVAACSCCGRPAPARPPRCWRRWAPRRCSGCWCRGCGHSPYSPVAVLGGGRCVVVAGGGAALAARAPLHPRASGNRARPRNPPRQRLCSSLWALRPVALQPKGVVFTFVDLGPRLITVTHHDAITGPYHRNGQQIADVMNAFSRQRRSGARDHRANIAPIMC